MSIQPVILAGGVGSRLWPLSRQQYPKQFLPLTHSKLTMLQETLQRAHAVSSETPIIVVNENYRFIVAEQLQQIGMKAHIVLEPSGKNTAPAIALAAHLTQEKQSESVLMVLSADHKIASGQGFINAMLNGAQLARDGYMVTFGVAPSHAETGYGYIRYGNAIGPGFIVDEFVEKPDQSTAEYYLRSGLYTWNSGIFMCEAGVYLNQLQQYREDIAHCVAEVVGCWQTDLDFIRSDSELWAECPSESIDYAVLEHSNKVATVPLGVKWSDVGSFETLYHAHDHTEEGNAVYGDVLAVDARSNLLVSEKGLVAAIGIEGLAVVNTKDVVLIAPLERSQEVKQLVNQLKRDGREEADVHKGVARPWGNYQLIDEGVGFKVKRIRVKPGGRLSVQKHQHRAEHWVVVTGVATVRNGDRSYIVESNESTYIPIGQIHSLANETEAPLELIEIQSGDYLGEDDIVRLSDEYGR